MTDPETEPAPTFPRLYVPADDEAADAVAYAECVTFPTGAALYEPPPTTDTVSTDSPFTSAYLVVLTCTCEDAAVGLFADREEAVAFAREVRDNPEAHAARYFAAIESTQHYPSRDWLSVAVIEFSGPVPARRTVLFELN